jgi:rubrerythrin
MKTVYKCQICGNIVEGRPDEWCPICGGHRIIFKRIILDDEELTLAS